MVLEDICEFEDAIERAQEFDKALIYFELKGRKDRKPFIPKDEKLGIMIGSEGGFDRRNQKAEKAGWKTATLGKRILRGGDSGGGGAGIVFAGNG